MGAGSVDGKMGLGASKNIEVRLPHGDKRYWTEVIRLLTPISRTSNLQWEEVLDTLARLSSLSDLAAQGKKPNFPSLYDFIRYSGNYYLPLCQSIATWALEASQHFPSGQVRGLPRGREASVDLSSLQVRCLLALMFWCVIPRRSPQSSLPKDATFYRIFSSSGDVQISKIYCFFSYFYVSYSCPVEPHLSFYRVHTSAQLPNDDKALEPINVLEDAGTQMEWLQTKVKVDFADRQFGGGVLGRGAAQEECLMLSYVEPIAGLLFIEESTDNDVIYIDGARIFNQYSGYRDTFCWTQAITPQLGNTNVILVMSSCDYRGKEARQYAREEIEREFTKACIGFSGGNLHPEYEIATGNWGCGVFNGDLQLKFLIQWLAASFSRRRVSYVTFAQPELAGAQQLVNQLSGYSAKRLLSLLLEYEPYYQHQPPFQYAMARMFQENAGSRSSVSKGAPAGVPSGHSQASLGRAQRTCSPQMGHSHYMSDSTGRTKQPYPGNTAQASIGRSQQQGSYNSAAKRSGFNQQPSHLASHLH